MNTLYSLCWIFQLRIAIRVTKKTTRYAGYYAGFDEIAMTPGKLAMLPSWELSDVPAQCVLQDKLTEDQALERTWEYNKTGVQRKFRIMSVPPVLEEHVTERSTNHFICSSSTIQSWTKKNTRFLILLPEILRI